jgi:hypothetical protein
MARCIVARSRGEGEAGADRGAGLEDGEVGEGGLDGKVGEGGLEDGEVGAQGSATSRKRRDGGSFSRRTTTRPTARRASQLAPLRGRRGSSYAGRTARRRRLLLLQRWRLGGDCGEQRRDLIWIECVIGKKRGEFKSPYTSFTRSAPRRAVLRVILPVAHAGEMRYG